MKSVEELATGQLLPGMVVAEAVVDESGRVLIPAGVALSESTIASLVRRDLPALKIEREVAADPAEIEAYRLSLLQRMEHLFRHAGQGEPARALYQTIIDYRMEHRS